MKQIVLATLIALSATVSHAKKDERVDAVLNSVMVKSILYGLRKEQSLKCKIAIEEDGSQSISFYDENGVSRFRAAFLCDDGRAAIIQGVFGDGQPATDAFELVHGS